MNPDARELVGLFALIIVLRELLPFLLNLVKPKDRDDAMLIMQTQTGILGRLEAAAIEHGKMLTENKYHADAIRVDTTAIRQGVHDIKGYDQAIIGLLKMRQHPREDE